MNAEFLYSNYFNTTTLCTVGSGSTTVGRLIDKNEDLQYQSSGFNDDTLGVTITVKYASAKNIDHIIIQNTNFKSFKVYYNSNAANTFTLIDGETSASDWTQNSTTNLFLRFATISVDSISIAGTTTMIANQEKKVGELWTTARRHIMAYNPAAKDYRPKDDAKEWIHEMSNGGTVRYRISEKWQAKIKYNYVSDSERTSFKALYDANTDMIFLPFPTGTSWNNEIYAVNWVGNWDFVTPAANNWNEAGWKGSLDLREIP
jgi:hypothetical protein